MVTDTYLVSFPNGLFPRDFPTEIEGAFHSRLHNKYNVPVLLCLGSRVLRGTLFSDCVNLEINIRGRSGRNCLFSENHKVDYSCQGYSLERSPSSETNRRSTSQKFPHI
jgi:hypothetical protein